MTQKIKIVLFVLAWLICWCAIAPAQQYWAVPVVQIQAPPVIYQPRVVYQPWQYQRTVVYPRPTYIGNRLFGPVVLEEYAPISRPIAHPQPSEVKQ